MEFLGFSLTQILTTLGIAGAAVFVLYLLKLRRRLIEVPFVKLWETILAEKQTTRLFSQLKRWLSLLVALLVVAALAFALGDPRYKGATATGRTVVLLLDASASMQATDVDEGRFALAKKKANDLINGMGPSDRFLIAELAASATPMTPLTGEQRILTDAIESMQASDLSADLLAGIQLAADILRDQSDPEVILISDGGVVGALHEDTKANIKAGDKNKSDLEEETESVIPLNHRAFKKDGIRFSWVPIGKKHDNVGITAFSVRRYPLDKSQSEVLVELWNPTKEKRGVELTLIGDGEPVDVQRLELKPEERLRRFFRNVSGVDQTLEAKITPAGQKDFLEVDNHAYARLPERRRARVAVVSNGNLYLQAALLLDEYLDVTEVSPSAWPSTDPYDVVIFDRVVPRNPPTIPALYLRPEPQEGSAAPFEVDGEVEGPYIERVDRKHPLIKWTALSDVNIASALSVKLQSGDKAVARQGRTPLIVTGKREGVSFVAFTFDPKDSDLVLRVAWPLILLNTVDWFVQENAGFVSSFRAGETWRVPAPKDIKEVEITDPHGLSRMIPVIEGRAVFAGTRAGFHTMKVGDETETFAANLDGDRESLVKPSKAIAISGQKAKEASSGKVGLRTEIWLYLVLLVLAILFIEWTTYHRRISV